MTVCKRVVYSGHVQGVGFRYTTQRLAEDFEVAGYVRNLRSGDVELVAEGAAEEVEKFLAAVERQMGRFITSHDVHDETPAGRQGFVIRA